MPGLKRRERLLKLVLLPPCDDAFKATVDLGELARQLDSPDEATIAVVDDRLCGPGMDAAVAEHVKRTRAEAIVVGGPSPRTHGEAWRRAASGAGIPAGRVEVVPLWTQCAHLAATPAAALRRARIMLEAAMARVDLGPEASARTVEASQSVLVIGGGVAGMQATVDLGDLGHRVFLVERSDALGGRTVALSRTFPTQECKPDGCCPESCRDCIFTPKPDIVLSHPRVEVMLGTEPSSIEGGIGGYRATLRTPKGDRTIEVGAVVVATGTVLFDPAEMAELSPGHPDVVTTLELERMLDAAKRTGGGSGGSGGGGSVTATPLTRPSDGRVPRSVHFLQCVGSRDAHHGTRECSIVCCTYAVGQALELKRTMPPGTEVAIHYMDMRGPYRGFERLYQEAQEAGVLFLRGRVAQVEPFHDHLVIEGEETHADEPTSWDADLVVLTVGQLPAPGSVALGGMLGVPVDEDGHLMEYNAHWGVLERRGVYVVGCAAGPRGIRYSVRDGREAALAIHVALRHARLELGEGVAEVDEGRCTGCGQCMEACEYDAIDLEARTDPRTGRRRQLAVVDERLCRACGGCVTACPSTAISIPGFSDGQMVRQIEVSAGERPREG